MARFSSFGGFDIGDDPDHYDATGQFATTPDTADADVPEDGDRGRGSASTKAGFAPVPARRGLLVVAALLVCGALAGVLASGAFRSAPSATPRPPGPTLTGPAARPAPAPPAPAPVVAAPPAGDQADADRSPRRERGERRRPSRLPSPQPRSRPAPAPAPAAAAQPAPTPPPATRVTPAPRAVSPALPARRLGNEEFVLGER